MERLYISNVVMDEASFEELLRIQNNMASLVVQEAEVDSKIKVLTIIDAITGGKKKKVQTEHLLIECQNEGMSENEAMRTLDTLRSDGLISDVDVGYIVRS